MTGLSDVFGCVFCGSSAINEALVVWVMGLVVRLEILIVLYMILPQILNTIVGWVGGGRWREVVFVETTGFRNMNWRAFRRGCRCGRGERCVINHSVVNSVPGTSCLTAGVA